MASNWAQFWAVDLHLQTPAGDAKDEDFGTAADVVSKALDAGLNAIAVTVSLTRLTDHTVANVPGVPAATQKRAASSEQYVWKAVHRRYDERCLSARSMDRDRLNCANSARS